MDYGTMLAGNTSDTRLGGSMDQKVEYRFEDVIRLLLLLWTRDAMTWVEGNPT